ncbi:MAG TPA: zf-HC2 domain-containing protein [Actinomycetota bacterium]|nr:zf-HC2 domain-containing protein [Actinomycetota bacterium]
MRHEDARTLASARADGELEAAGIAELEAHLAGCDECRAFTHAIPRLGALARALPEPALRDGFAVPSMSTRRTRRIRRPRLAGWAAAAVVAAIALLVSGLPAGGFRVEPAGAAEALLTIRTLDVTREIVETSFDGTRTTTIERIRYRAPATTRIDRTVTDARGTATQTEIRLPGARALIQGSAATLQTGLPPDPNMVPEPLSPSLALAGRVTGPGPQVAGRATERVVLESPDGTVVREALIDASQASLLSSEVAVVLRKQAAGARRTVAKRVTAIAYNVTLDDSLFALPTVPAGSGGFRPQPPASLSMPPAATPDGFSVVHAGSGPAGDAVLYARGAFTILVQTGPRAETEDDTVVTRPARAGDGEAWYLIGLYDLPALRFRSGGTTITISAPMTREQLEAVAARMYP